MKIPQFFGKKKILQTTIAEQSSYIKELQVTNANIILRLQDDVNSTGNQYPNKGDQVNALQERYKGEASWGNELVKRIVNVAAATQLPNGIALDGPDGPEKTYLEKFIDSNQLNQGMAIQYAREAQIQGQVLTELLWDADDNLVKCKYLPWNKHNYTILPTGLNNMTAPYAASYDDETSQTITLKNEQISFVAFNLQLNDDGSLVGYPALGGLVNQLDNISRDLENWKTINRLFSHPTPNFKCIDQKEAEIVRTEIQGNWTVGNALATTAEFSMISPESGYYQTISEGITFNLKLISGGSGVAVSWLGWPDIMSNRATADSLGEPLEIVGQSDINAWESFYEVMFDNVIKIRNENIGTNQQLREGIIKPLIQPISDRKWSQIIKFWMPAAKDSLIAKETLWEKIPDLDIDEEKKRGEEIDAEAEKKRQEFLSSAENNNNVDEDGNDDFAFRREGGDQ